MDRTTGIRRELTDAINAFVYESVKMRNRPYRSALRTFVLALAPVTLLPAAEPDFAGRIQPLLAEFCMTCHSAEKQKGDLDLESVCTPEGIRRHPKIWQGVLTQMEEGEMPPKDKLQLSPEQKREVLTWLRGTLDALALERAGDPGPVVMRRLSNAEYTCTVRDLTGVASLDPAREFPVDGAAGEGFTNTGQSLVMSPTLLTKYLDAAKEIASHAVLTPRGIRFSPHTTRRDWTEETLTEIRSFYQTFTAPGGVDMVTRQGIPLDQTRGGRLPLEQYLAATLQIRDGAASLPLAAAQHGLSPKYLGLLLDYLTRNGHSVLGEGIRESWRKTTPATIPALAGEIADWQQSLWKFSSVGHIGKAGGPKAWMEPVNPLTARQEFSLKLDQAAVDGDLVVYLSCGDAGDGAEGDVVVWQEPRLVLRDGPPLLLRDLRSLTIADGDPFRFGRPPGEFDAHGNLRATAPSIIEIKLPADLAAGATFTTAGVLDQPVGTEGSVQLRVLPSKPNPAAGLQPGGAVAGEVAGLWSSNNQRVYFNAPIVANPGSNTEKTLLAGFEEFRRIFPAALCYSKIVPVDEVVTLTLFYREDGPLRGLLLNDAQTAKLDQMWDELHFVSQDALTLVDAFEQLWQFATQDADPAAFTPMREPIRERAERFRQTLVATGPVHLQAVLDFANQAWRQPLTAVQQTDLKKLYETFRNQDLPHEEAIRLLLARVLVTPAFLYKSEKPGPGTVAAPLPDHELAVRLSYFLWSSQPDAELRAAAGAGTLHQPAILLAQARRMLADGRTRRLATEFGCAWLHVHGLDELDEKSERHFPDFKALRGSMYEETRQFLTDFFRSNGSVLNLLDADHTFLNEALATHYGIPGITGHHWRRVDGIRTWDRGGIIGQAAVLSKQSGASRTSPILRGNWVAEALLGDKLPRPPKDVPPLPEDETNDTLTVRQLTEKHTTDPRCATCHARIDAFGFSLEHYDAIGRYRDKDTGGRVILAQATVPDGTVIDGLDGLRQYLSGSRREDFVQQFCRKLLGYSLGRSVQLSDQPLLQEMARALAANHYRVHTAVEMIVLSRQFREIRGLETAFEDQ